MLNFRGVPQKTVGRIVPRGGTPSKTLRRCFLEARGLDQMQQPPQKIGEAGVGRLQWGSVQVAISSALKYIPKKTNMAW